MKTKVQLLREEKHLTQTGLAQESGLSLRTIQRIEAGNIPKGFTLKTLAKALQTETENLIADNGNVIARAKLINVSVLSSLVIPFGNIIFPSILTYKTKEPEAKALGRNIISFQILYSFILGILLILSPFVQKAFLIQFPLFLIVLIVLKCINVFIIIKNSASLNQKSDLYIKLKYSFL